MKREGGMGCFSLPGKSYMMHPTCLTFNFTGIKGGRESVKREREKEGMEAFLCCNCAQLLPGVHSLQFKGVMLWWLVREREEEKMEAFFCCTLCTIATLSSVTAVHIN